MFSGGWGGLWRRVRGWLPGLLVSLAAVAALARLADWNELAAAFGRVQPAALLGAVAIMVVSLGLRAMAWRVFLGARASLWRAFLIVNEGYLLNNLFPLRAGEIGRAVFMGQASGLGTFHVLSTILIERIFDVAIAAGLLLATLPLALGLAWARPVAVSALILVGAALAGLWAAARARARVHAWLERFAGRWGWFNRLVLPRLDALFNGLSALTDPRQALLGFLFMAASWGLSVVQYFVVMQSFVPGAPLWWAAFTQGVLAMGVSVPSAPGALGVLEAAVTGALVVLGVPASTGLAFALALRALQFLTTGLLGTLGLAREGQAWGSFLRRLQGVPAPEK